MKNRDFEKMQELSARQDELDEEELEELEELENLYERFVEEERFHSGK